MKCLLINKIQSQISDPLTVLNCCLYRDRSFMNIVTSTWLCFKAHIIEQSNRDSNQGKKKEMVINLNFLSVQVYLIVTA